MSDVPSTWLDMVKALAEKHGVRLVKVGRDEIVVEGDEAAKLEFFLDVAAMLET